MKWLLVRILPVLVVVSLLLGACNLPQTVSVATSAPAGTLEPGATSTAAQSDDVWDRIVANKKIVVGTSWDYPPFSYTDLNLQGQGVGLDIALIKEIGRRLKIPIDIQSFTFEELPAALQKNQVDLAIAAISVTPERANQMSFSPIYYVNETAVLARTDSPLAQITNLNQLAGQRVAVQRGSTYEKMAQTSLVDTGLIHADQLVSYVKSDEAVQGLVTSQVDLLITGLATANYYSSRQGLKVIGKGFDQQNLAVAMRTGTPRLKAEIDRVMTEMLTDGTLLGLIQEYIQNDVSDVLPTSSPVNLPTPIPATQTAPQGCQDAMKFIADVTFADNDMTTAPFVKPGAGFVKVWRIQNTGTCIWTNYRLVYAYGNTEAARMNGQPVNIPGSVLPGQTIDLSVTLIAPQDPFTYQGFWQVENAKGVRLGRPVWVTITTQGDPYSTSYPYGQYCQVTVSAPKHSLKVRTDFDAVWTVTNISGKDWSSGSIDFEYVSGTKMHKYEDAYDYGDAIDDGESGKFMVDMIAPNKPGVYSTQWVIISGSKRLCTLNLSVTVTAK
jgi:ABC-type amino acid transport substrate-binding protein